MCHKEDIDHFGLHRKKDFITKINEVREARQAAIDDGDGENEVEFDEDVASRPLKLALVIVAERSPQTFSGYDYN